MANFKTHLNVAALGSVTASVVCLQQLNITVEQALILFILGSVAGMLPDIDSNYSIPARWIFRLLTLTVVVSVAFYGYERLPYLHLAAWMAGVFLMMRYIIIRLLMSMTVHRGLFHSVPTAGLFGISTYYLGTYSLLWTPYFSWLAGGFVTGGYLLHLMLDEAYSVDLQGRTLKKSFGSALTFVSRKSWRAYVFLYILLGSSTLYALGISGEEIFLLDTWKIAL
ncbi:MAG: metal-dependent hydrolase [Ghiorsea sp.]|nr:metal-dependent hydrolase [Ghiorsea sp.]